MLLETFDSEGESLIVYSRNILSSDENFRMIFKKDPEKIRKLFLYDICGLINNKTPKNLVAYSLLTNLEDLSITQSRMGCFINASDTLELIYPDPIYAVNELELLSAERYLPNLKFRIQQVGFTGITRGESTIFNEVFRFDLDSLEAQAQNDTVFVEALLKEEKRFKTLNHSLDGVLSEVKEPGIEKADLPVFKQTKDFSFKSLFEKSQKQTALSCIEIFKSPDSLKEYLKPKLKKRFILKLTKK